MPTPRQNRDLGVVWEGDGPLRIHDASDAEQVLARNGIGYVSESEGAVHEVRDGLALVVRSSGAQR
jgi:hypothetical protein